MKALILVAFCLFYLPIFDSLRAEETASLSSRLYYLKSGTIMQEVDQFSAGLRSHGDVLRPEQVAFMERVPGSDRGLKRALRVHFKDGRPGRLFYLHQSTLERKVGEITDLQSEVEALLSVATGPPSASCPPELTPPEEREPPEADFARELAMAVAPRCSEGEASVATAGLGQTLWELAAGCGGGALNSIGSILRFTWEIMKWVWANATSAEAREKTGEAVSGAVSGTSDWASEAMDSAQLYLHSEYQRAYLDTSLALPPKVRKAVALIKMDNAIGTFALARIYHAVGEQVEHFWCLPARDKADVVCHLLSDILAPPTGAIALVKYGPRAATQVPRLGRALAALKDNPRIIAASQRAAQAARRGVQAAERLASRSTIGRRAIGFSKGVASAARVVGRGTLAVGRGAVAAGRAFHRLDQLSDRAGVKQAVANAGYQAGRMAGKLTRNTIRAGQSARQGLANTGAAVRRGQERAAAGVARVGQAAREGAQRTRQSLQRGAEKAREGGARSRRAIADSAGFVGQTARSLRQRMDQTLLGLGVSRVQTQVAAQAPKSGPPASNFGFNGLKSATVRSEIPKNSPLNPANALKPKPAPQAAAATPSRPVQAAVSEAAPAVPARPKEVWDSGLKAYIPEAGPRGSTEWGWTSSAGQVFWDGKKWMRPPHLEYGMKVNRLNSSHSGFYGLARSEQRIYDRLERSFNRRYGIKDPRPVAAPAQKSFFSDLSQRFQNWSSGTTSRASTRQALEEAASGGRAKPKLGQSVSIGVGDNVYNGKVTELLGNSSLNPSGPARAKIHYRDRSGYEWDRIVEGDRLYRPLRVANGRLGVGDQISYIGPFGRTSAGKIEKVRSGQVKVSFKNWRGREVEEWVALKDVLGNGAK